jgi:lysozyme
MESLEDRIRHHEGKVNKLYKDSLGKATVGIGHLIREDEKDEWKEGVEYSDEVIEKVFKEDLEIATTLCDNMFMCDLSYKPPKLLREIYIEMIFQLGAGGVSKFKKTFDYVKMKKFKHASIEMLDSRWNKQTPNRAKALSDLMATVTV